MNTCVRCGVHYDESIKPTKRGERLCIPCIKYLRVWSYCLLVYLCAVTIMFLSLLYKGYIFFLYH